MARDQRLTAQSLGSWDGAAKLGLADEPLYQQFVAGAAEVRPPGGELTETVRRRAAAAVHQALEDAVPGDLLVIVTHSSLIPLLVDHFIDAPENPNLHLCEVPASLSILSFANDGSVRLQASNWHTERSTNLAAVLTT